jgi:ABC-2 type transport system ATP-binding protein
VGAIISTRSLTKHYGDTVAVDDLDLEIRRGEVFGLLGPNGAGKTTTILMLLGLTEPTSGEVEVLGFDPRHHALDIKAAVGYLPDSVGFYEHMTGRQNLRYTARLNRIPGDERESRIDEVSTLVGITDQIDRKVGGYSRGMRQRLGLADALLKKPSVLILDEPTVNIDPAGVEEILSLVKRLAQRDGVTVLLSSHLLHQVQEICDRIGIFVSGRLAAMGRIDELSARLEDRVLIEVSTGAPSDGDVAGVLGAIDGVTSVRRDDAGRWRVSATSDVRAAIADALHDAGHGITHLRRVSAELDAVYRRYFHGEGVPDPEEVKSP